MTISYPFNRDKAVSHLTENLTFSGNIADGTNGWIVDICATFTPDTGTPVTKTLFRIELPFTVSDQEIAVNAAYYAFTGSEPAYASGGSTPPLSDAHIANSLDLNQFLINGGDSQKNS